jgi:predicted RNase H-like nuclease (RuvC/YqgF family)
MGHKHGGGGSELGRIVAELARELRELREAFESRHEKHQDHEIRELTEAVRGLRRQVEAQGVAIEALTRRVSVLEGGGGEPGPAVDLRVSIGAPRDQ